MDRMKLAAEVAARLRAERARANLTLKEAAEKSKVHYVTISRYESGKEDESGKIPLPTLDALYRLAEAYGIDVAVLLPPSATVEDLPRKGKK